MFSLFVVCGLLIGREGVLFPLFLFLDLVMFLILVRRVLSVSGYFISVMVLCVLRGALGMVILMGRARKFGRDKIL